MKFLFVLAQLEAARE